MIQNQLPDIPMSNYLANQGADTSKLGIYNSGRIHIATQDVSVLKSTAADIVDTWSMKQFNWKIELKGGEKQFFTSDVSAWRTLTVNRLELFKKALKLTSQKLEEHPNYFILNSIIMQLQYLIEIEERKAMDLSNLTNMTIGRITAYDINNLDENLASTLYEVSAQIHYMQKEYLRK